MLTPTRKQHQVLNNQVNKIAQPIDLDQTSAEQSWSWHNGDDHVAEMEVTYGPSRMDSHLKRPIWLLMPVNI